MAVRIGGARHTLEKVTLPGGVVCMCRPCTTAIWESALAHARRTVAALIAGEEVMEDLGIDTDLLPDLSDPDAQEGFRKLLFVQALARHAIKSWKGVEEPHGGDAKGQKRWRPAPVTHKAIAELMNIHRMAEEFIDRYGRNVLQRYAEGNASRLSPNGTSGGGRNTAKAAKRRVPPARKAASA